VPHKKLHHYQVDDFGDPILDRDGQPIPTRFAVEEQEKVHASFKNFGQMDARQEAASPLYPFRFVTKDTTDKKFSTFAQFRAVVLYPYDMDLMSFYEFYSIAMPIFMPTELSKYIFHQQHTNYAGQAYCADKNRVNWGRGCVGNPLWKDKNHTPFDERNIMATRQILQHTDYVNYPYVQGFASLPDLLKKLMSVDYQDISTKMRAFNEDSYAKTSEYFQKVLWCMSPRKMQVAPNPKCFPIIRDPLMLQYTDSTENTHKSRGILPGLKWDGSGSAYAPEPLLEEDLDMG
jgi:hypothetical protein